MKATADAKAKAPAPGSHPATPPMEFDEATLLSLGDYELYHKDKTRMSIGSVEVKEVANLHGVEVIAAGRLIDHKAYSTLQLWAPAGKVFRATGSHYHHAVHVNDLSITGAGPDWSSELDIVSDLVDA